MCAAKFYDRRLILYIVYFFHLFIKLCIYLIKMEPIVSFKTKMCRICPNTLDLIDLSLPENYFIIKNLDSLVFIEVKIKFTSRPFLKKTLFL